MRTEDFIFAIRKDAKKYARIEDLLHMDQELRRARNLLNDNDIEQFARDDDEEEEEVIGMKSKRRAKGKASDMDAMAEAFGRRADDMDRESNEHKQKELSSGKHKQSNTPSANNVPPTVHVPSIGSRLQTSHPCPPVLKVAHPAKDEEDYDN